MFAVGELAAALDGQLYHCARCALRLLYFYDEQIFHVLIQSSTRLWDPSIFLFHISFDAKKKHKLGIAQLANLQRCTAVSI